MRKRPRRIQPKGDKTDLKKVDGHVPLAAIADEFLSEVLHEAVVDGQVDILDRELEVVVGLV